MKINLTKEEAELLYHWIGCWEYVEEPPSKRDIEQQKIFESISKKLSKVN